MHFLASVYSIQDIKLTTRWQTNFVSIKACQQLYFTILHSSNKATSQAIKLYTLTQPRLDIWKLFSCLLSLWLHALSLLSKITKKTENVWYTKWCWLFHSPFLSRVRCEWVKHYWRKRKISTFFSTLTFFSWTLTGEVLFTEMKRASNIPYWPYSH